jgi:hypothetical protein
MTPPSPGQQRAVQDLERLAQHRPDLLAIVGPPAAAENPATIRIRLPTGELERRDGGLLLQEAEEFLVVIPPWFPLVEPVTGVDHDRFAGHPHVIAGRRLCVHLDPARQWNPNLGIIGYLNRLWDWLADAAAGRFDPTNALFHPVGGVLHHTPGTPMVVVREAIPSALTNRLFLRAGLAHRTPQRLDLTGWHPGRRHLPAEVAAVVLLPGPLVYGGGTDLGTLLAGISLVGVPTADQVAAELFDAAAHNPPGSPTYLLVGARNANPALPQDHHLLAAQIPPELTEQMRTLAQQRRQRHGPAAAFHAADLPQDLPLQWCPVSDERPGIATRRDHRRPASWFAGKHIEVWGCGGLGAWIAEAVVRAGAARVTLRDSGLVTSGLLVRQNYTEADVGAPKAKALAARLRGLSDRVRIDAHHENVIGTLADGHLPACDLVIDATVNTTVALLLDHAATRTTGRRPYLAAVATDTPTATLGLLTVAALAWPGGPYDLERRHSPGILRDGRLEHFHIFWADPGPDHMVIPERGCSVPTFHGAANDLMTLAGTTIDLLARRLAAAASGIDLFAAAHAPLPEHAPRFYSQTPQAPPDLRSREPGGYRLRTNAETLSKLRAVLASPGPARWIAVGEQNDTGKTVWLDDLLPMPPQAPPAEAEQLTSTVADATYGISRYLGEALLLTDNDQPSVEDPRVASAIARTRATSGSAVLVLTVANADIRFAVHPIDPNPG